MSAAPSSSAAAGVDRILSEAESLKFSDHQRMLVVASEAAAQAQTLGDFYRYAVALNHQAWAYAILNRHESSLTHALEALMLARAYGYPDVEARTVNVLALNFAECGIVQEAIRLYEHQLEIGRRLEDPELTSMALHDLALVHLNEGEYETALALLQESIQLTPPTLHDGLDLSITHGNLALIFCRLDRLDDALHHAQQALALASAAESQPQIGQAHFILGSIYLARGSLHDARQHASFARLYTSLSTGLALNYETLSAEIFAREDRHLDSVAAWERAYTLAIGAQIIESALGILDCLKSAYEHLGDMSGVVSAYQRMTTEIPGQQKRSSDLRFTVLRTVFAIDKAAIQAKLHLNDQKHAILHRLSHEFRTPLTIIQSTAEMVEKYGDRLSLAQRQERLQRISTQVRWMTVLLEDIVELLKLEDAGFAALPAEPLTLETLAQDALAGLERYRLPTAVVHVTLQPNAGTVHISHKSVETILVHLLTNAVKFSKTDVQLTLSVEGRLLVICVADHGIGIPVAEQQLVFQPLIRGSNLDEISGNGLGLALVAKLVERMHGTVELQSVEGVGTTVTVRLPV
ncbi:MAG: tetratricopeptide repeat-containing sensor histidine kinase [Chloroflexi bacterium]|nr:tetratricopeptide repeat-containing sensor histidine kinase [Chloroflexota bacterium]